MSAAGGSGHHVADAGDPSGPGIAKADRKPSCLISCSQVSPRGCCDAVREEKPMRKADFLVLIISLSLSVVACETILRFVNYAEPIYGWAAPLRKGNFHSAEGAIRILLLGDSQVAGRLAATIPGELLEKALNSETTQFSD